MKNLPHQINKLVKLHAALSVFLDLQQRGEDLDDNGVVGIAMARAGSYPFRDKSLTLQEALAREREKPKGSQGTRTFARDLRRFFTLARFVERDVRGTLRISGLGRHLLGMGPASEGAKQVWRTALRQLVLEGEGGASHPYRILLRLVSDRPGLQAARLALALEGGNDSEEEYERLLSLADRGTWEEALDRMRTTDAMARNATKILPALARQVGDLREEGGRYFLGAARGISDDVEASGGPLTQERRRARAGHRRVDADEIATIPAAPEEGEEAPSEDSYVPPWETAERRRERLERHQLLVRSFAGFLTNHGYELSEDPYDLLARHAGWTSILVEAKTIHESHSDEGTQVRAALGQLFYYEHFEVPPDLRESGLLKLALFDRPISEEHVTLFESLGVITVWQTDDGFYLPDWSRGQLGETAELFDVG